MGYLFPINPADRVKREPDKSRVEKIGDDEKGFFSKRDQDRNLEEEFKEIEKKVDKLVKTDKFLKSLHLDALDSTESKAKLLKLAETAAADFLKKELLNVARSILSLSAEENLQEVDESNLSFSESLARYVMRIKNTKKRSSKKSKVKYGKANPLQDRNAGFLVHYCKDILKKKIKQEQSPHDLKKLSKKEAEVLLKG